MDTTKIEHKERVVVRRNWHSPEILAFISPAGVGASMDLNDFCRALVEEVFKDKARLLMLSKSDALAKVLEAKDNIMHEMKMTTTHVT